MTTLIWSLDESVNSGSTMTEVARDRMPVIPVYKPDEGS